VKGEEEEEKEEEVVVVLTKRVQEKTEEARPQPRAGHQ